MTLVLAVETATPVCSVAVGDEGGVRASSSAEGDRRHVETLAPAIADTCVAAGVALDDLDALAVDVGPGLFTGMRVGIATVQGLALALGLEVLPVSSLEVLAVPLVREAQPVVSVVDARRGEVFSAVYQAGVRLAGPVCLAPEELAQRLTALGPCVAVGDGAARYETVLAGAGAEVRPSSPSAEAVLHVAFAARDAGARALDPAAIEACYLRSPDARANFVVLSQAGG